MLTPRPQLFSARARHTFAMRCPMVAAFLLLSLWPSFARSAPLAGRWEGVFHGGRGDQPVALICRPGASGKLGGLLYLNGEWMGPLEGGTYSRDSLHFRAMNFA